MDIQAQLAMVQFKPSIADWLYNNDYEVTSEIINKILDRQKQPFTHDTLTKKEKVYCTMAILKQLEKLEDDRAYYKMACFGSGLNIRYLKINPRTLEYRIG